MRVVYERCCGLDVHKKSVMACVMTPEGQETRTFGTTTRELLALAEWLERWEVTHVAMESTGVYWKPLFNLLEAMVGGIEDPKVLAALARGKLQEKQPALEEALQGLMGPHQRLLLASHLRHLDFLDAEVTRMDEEVEARLSPFTEALERLDEIPGVGRRVAEDVVAEIGLDMSRFPTDAHIASWAKLCPGNNESAGKRKGGSRGHGNVWLTSILVEAAKAAGRTRGSYLSSQYHHLAARRGKSRAAVAVAHSILVVVYHMLRRGTRYEDLGPNYFDERHRQATLRRTVLRLERLGYKVALEAA